MSEITCPECKSAAAFIFFADRFNKYRDATSGKFRCTTCQHEWRDKKYWRKKYTNLVYQSGVGNEAM
jgi:hypothetical protein